MLAWSFFSLASFPAWAQLAIEGPTQGFPGQVLTFKLFDGAAAVIPDAWEQGFNPDRYAGNDYATSFNLQLTPQQDGSVQLIAPAPGRYRLIAYKGGNLLQLPVLVRPPPAPSAIRGISFLLSADGAPSDIIRNRAVERLTVAKNMGISWIHLTIDGCIEVDMPNMPLVNDPANCYTVPQPDLEWIFDQAHQLGYKIVFDPGVQGIQGGHTQGDTPLSVYMAGLTEAQILQAQASFCQFLAQMAALAQKHNIEALMIGSGWDLYKVTPSPALIAALNQQWSSLLDQVRSGYSGKVWMGWSGACGQWQPFNLWSRVDGIRSLIGGIGGSGVNCSNTANGSPPGIFNLPAEEMVSNFSNLSNLPAFQLQSETGLPLIWTDYYPVPYDGSNFYQAAQPWNGIAVSDTQEMIDGFEARMRASLPAPGDGFFAWATTLNNFGYGGDLLSVPAFVHGASNWWHGDPTYFESCLTTPPAGVLFQSDLTCPVGLFAFNLQGAADAIADPSNPQNQILRVRADSDNMDGWGNGAARWDVWSDFVLSQKIRISSPGAAANVFFRSTTSGPYATYTLVFDGSSVSLAKNVTGQPYRVLATSAVQSIGLNQWATITLTAVGSMLSVSVDGAAVLKTQDNDNPLLSGTSYWTINNSPAASVDYDAIIVSTPPVTPASGTPVILAVENATTSSLSTVAPGEIVVVYGSGLGPKSLSGLSLDANGNIAVSSGGTRVLVGGVAAPIIYAEDSQVAAIIPFEETAPGTNVVVEFQGTQSAPFPVAITGTAPGVFTTNQRGTGQAAAVNQDGSLNSPALPAAKGSYLTVFLTGQGQLNPEGVDGAISGANPALPAAQVTAKLGGVDALVQYAGNAPLETNGLLQVNLQVPSSAPSGAAVPLIIQIGNYVTQPNSTIAVQ